MNVLLDTCALLALSRGELPEAAARALRRAPEAYVSIVTPWEVAIKAARGKLRLADPPDEWFFALAERHSLLDINACTQEGGWVDELGHCGGGLDAYDCGGTLATMSWAQVCFDYCDYPQQQGVQDEWVDGGNAGCVCYPCT